MKTILYGLLCVMLVQACFIEAKQHNRLRNARQAYGYGAPAPTPVQQQPTQQYGQQRIPQQTFQQQAPVKQQTYSAPAPQLPPRQQPVEQSYSSFVRQEAPVQVPVQAPLRQESTYQQQQQLPQQIPQTYASVVRQPELPKEETIIDTPKQMDSYSSFVRQETPVQAPLRQESTYQQQQQLPQQIPQTYASVVRQPELPKEETIIDTPKQQSYGSVVRQEKTFTAPKAPLRQESSSFGSLRVEQPQQQYGQRMEQQLPVRQSSYGSSNSLMQETTETENRCLVGFEQPMWTENKITSFFCRCPSGTYGISCKENFVNPCVSDDVQYSPADASLGKQHFIECSNSLPYLFKCAGSLEWSQEKLTCDWPASFYAALEELVRQYNRETEQHQQQQQQSSYQQQLPQQQTPVQSTYQQQLPQQIKSTPVRSQGYGSYSTIL